MSLSLCSQGADASVIVQHINGMSYDHVFVISCLLRVSKVNSIDDIISNRKITGKEVQGLCLCFS